MAQIRRQEFVVSLADIAANPTKVLAANEFLYVRQPDGKLKMMCGDGATAISALPYSIDISAIEQAKIDAKSHAEQTGEDRIATGEDRVATGADRSAVNTALLGFAETTLPAAIESVENKADSEITRVGQAGDAQVQAVETEGTEQKTSIVSYCEEQQTIINQKVSAANNAKDDAVMAKEQAETARQYAETATQRAAEAAEHDILTQTELTDAQQAQARKNINAEKSKGAYELIETLTLTGDTTSVVRTQEPDGTPYAFKAIGVVVQAEVGSVNSGIMVHGNYESTRLQAGFINDAINDTIKKSGYAQIYPDWGVWTAIGSTSVNRFTYAVTQTTGYSPAQAFSVKESENPYCTQVTLAVNVSGATIPTGTIIQIYGVRA